MTGIFLGKFTCATEIHLAFTNQRREKETEEVERNLFQQGAEHHKEIKR